MKLSIAFGYSLVAAALGMPYPSSGPEPTSATTQTHRRRKYGDTLTRTTLLLPFSSFHRKNTIHCGGIILSDEFILTAAACIYDDSDNPHSPSSLNVGYRGSSIGSQTIVNALSFIKHSKLRHGRS
ncbi:hypothetical protein DL89DRAFT_128093 [Linderina pennispora]|uniref:Peptidase S1 domain-containing protein n=1 Tax=Linderina pennispora TaxID=61395 RepID=A0A1Y1WDY7_9FUNG|nr:uncharacterized protein DL89DRAFT_128093 [Linderina pennispora]ORX71538.1 hypothetical protein DL89DRAFT_128093 [Linderina pennispora]